MNKFILKLFIFIFLVFAIFFSVVLYKIHQPDGKYNFELIPKNNLSNSFSYRAKIDHLVKSDNYRNCTFLICGSSTSLCDISGPGIMSKTGEVVYNISSWGIRPNNTLDLLKIVDKSHVKYLLVSFSNADFFGHLGHLTPKININSTNSFINKCQLTRCMLFAKEMTAPVLFSDIKYRKENLYTSNSRGSICYDKTGGVQYDTSGFVFDNLWIDPWDTSGFSYFYSNVIELNSFCRQNNIRLLLTYIPVRNDMLTAEIKRQSEAVATILKNSFGSNFVDLHALEMPASEFCDGYHMFKDGAERVTAAFLDSVKLH